MGSNERHVALCIVIERAAGGKDPAKHFMAALDIRLLPGSSGITVKNLRARRTIGSCFDCRGIRELGPVIGKDHRKEGAEIIMPKALIEELDPIMNGLRRVVVSEEYRHKIPLEANCKENFRGSVTAEDGIHLDGHNVGMLGDVCIVLLKSTADPTILVDLPLRFGRFARLQFGFSRQIDVAGFKSALVNQPVNGTP